MGKDSGEKGAFKSLLGAALAPLTNRRRTAEKLYTSSDFQDLKTERLDRGLANYSILRYQHVLTENETPVPLHPSRFVTPATFRKHLRFIAENCEPMHVSELMRRELANETIPENAVAITFDNGHADVFLNAFPLLLEYDIPATVSLPTGYIEKETYLLDDRLALALLAIRELKSSFPVLECFSDEFYKELKQESPKLEITPKLAARVIEEFRALPEVTRAMMMQTVGETLSTAVTLPEYEDFIRWDDVNTMKEHGVEFASMGHTHVLAAQVEADYFTLDVMQSIQEFIQREIALEKFFCLVEGVFTSQRLTQLKEVGYQVVLGVGDFPRFELQKSEPKILGRVNMWEQIGQTDALFACRLFRVVADDMEF